MLDFYFPSAVGEFGRAFFALIRRMEENGVSYYTPWTYDLPGRWRCGVSVLYFRLHV